jgi:hypothetical protein
MTVECEIRVGKNVPKPAQTMIALMQYYNGKSAGPVIAQCLSPRCARMWNWSTEDVTTVTCPYCRHEEVVVLKASVET